jgi:hypothetical protein
VIKNPLKTKNISTPMVPENKLIILGLMPYSAIKLSSNPRCEKITNRIDIALNTSKPLRCFI